MNNTVLNICHESIALLMKTPVAHFSHVAFCYKEDCFINVELHEGITPLGTKSGLLVGPCSPQQCENKNNEIRYVFTNLRNNVQKE